MYSADAGDGVVGITGTAGMSSGFGTAGTTGLLRVQVGADGKAHRSIGKREAAQTAFRAMNAAAAGVATYGSGATCGGAAIAGAAVGLVATAVEGGFTAYDAQKTRAKLLRLIDAVEAKSAILGRAGNDASSPEAMDGWELYNCLLKCVGKTEHKLAYAAGNISVVGQPIVAGVRAGRAIAKFAMGTKGVGRQTRSETLYRLASNTQSPWCQIANDAINAICAQKFEDFVKGALADAMKS